MAVPKSPPSADAGTLYLCATPIGNLGDITLRALEVLRAADLVLAEDTRRTGVLLKEHGIRAPLMSFHDRNEAERVPQVIGLLEQGRRVVLVSDAGSPLLADPGFRLVREAVRRGLPVTALPGASALLPALALSALPPHPFVFLGFLPRKAGQRRRLLAEAAALPWTIVCYETPHRLLEALDDLAASAGPDRPMAVARELTKRFEEVVRGTVAEVADRFRAQPPRGELVLVIAGAGQEEGGRPS